MSRVLRVVYFFEDIAHERFVRSLTKRVARECGVEIEEDVRKQLMEARSGASGDNSSKRFGKGGCHNRMCWLL
jgi:hypothetical protein